jgi:hypothetical protein
MLPLVIPKVAGKSDFSRIGTLDLVEQGIRELSEP